MSANAGKNGVANGGKVWEMAVLVMRVGVPGALSFFLSEIFEADLLLSFLNAQRSWSASCQSSAKLLSLPAEWFVRQAGFRV